LLQSEDHQKPLALLREWSIGHVAQPGQPAQSGLCSVRAICPISRRTTIMTKQITERQRQLLERAAAEPITDAEAVDSSVSCALIQKNLVIWLLAEGEGSRLIVTQAGLAALAAADAKKTAKAAEDAGASTSCADQARADGQTEAGNSMNSAPAYADPSGPPAAVPAASLPKGKLGALVALLKRPEGADVEEMMAATGWQAHSVRGAMSGALKKKLGLSIESEKSAAGRVYRILPEARR
jgi:hypothetical protein